MKQAQDPNGLGRRRPRMATWAQPNDQNIRPITAKEPPPEPQAIRNQERGSDGLVTCPNCGEKVYRLISHQRWKCPKNPK